MGAGMTDAATQRTLYTIRENLSASLSGVLRGGAALDRHTVMNRRGEVLSTRSGTWSVDLTNALEVSEAFDPALVGGVAVVSHGIARGVILKRLRGELGVIEGNLRVN